MAGSTPPKDQDIFGKELSLSSAERNVLAGSGEIFLKKVLQVDTFSKKGDPTEPKTLVISNSRCYILTHRPALKLEASFNFLKIQLLECTETKLIFQLPGEKPREFHSTRRDSVEIIGLITAQLKNVFPITPLEMVLKLTFDPDSLHSDVTSLRDSLLSAMDRGDATSLQGFVTSYGFLCDFFGVTFNNEVSWYLKNIYLAHGFRDLNLSDFNHLSPRDLLPVLSTLRHNEFFEGLIVKDDKLTPELIEELCYVMNVSRGIKKLVLKNASIRPDNLTRLSLALKNNPRSVLVHLDLSDNILDDKSIEALGNALESLPQGLQQLLLANCKITNKGGSMLAQSMKQNKHMQYSLVHFDLSGNPIGPDPLGALTFIQDPQTISHLNLSGCGLTLDSVVQVLIRGCQQHLTTLDLSHNAGKGKKGILSTNVAAKLQQFFSSCIAINAINFTECRLTSEIVSAILEGLSVNPNVTSIDLNVSSNDLGGSRDPQSMAKVIARVQCLTKLNISDCGLDHCLPSIVDAITANTKLKHVAMGRNFNGKQPVRIAAMDKLCALLRKDDCHLLSLCVKDSKLKDLTFVLLIAVSDNTSLNRLSISGNQMGNHGARYLAKVLLTNCHLREVDWDHNDTTLCGLQEVASALEHNYTLRVMPLPLGDIVRAGKGAEEVVQQIQLRLCRNHSNERLKVELAAIHRGRLLTATQHSSVVSRELVQLEDLLQWAESVHGKTHEDVTEATLVKDQANKVLKLTDGLYSPQVESDQFEAISSQVKDLMDAFMDKVYNEHIRETSNRMVAQTLKACPTLLTEETKRRVQGMVLSSAVSSDFTYAKKAVTKRAAPEIVSYVSAINLDVAANISELIVDQTLTKLDKANLRLLKLHKAARLNSTTPDTKVSRNFTFRVDQDTPPKKKKKRVRRPDIEEEEEEQVDLPTQPLESTGPALQHLGKSRPKPARMQRERTRPSVKPAPVQEEIPTTKPEELKPPESRVGALLTPPETKKAILPPTLARTPSPQSRSSVSEPVREKTPTPTTTDEVKQSTVEATSTLRSEPQKADSHSEPPASQEDTVLRSNSTPKVSPKPRARPSPAQSAPTETKQPPEEDKSQSSSPDLKPEALPESPSPDVSLPTPEPPTPEPAPLPTEQTTSPQDVVDSPAVEDKLQPPTQEKPDEPSPSPVEDEPRPPSVEDKPSSPDDDKPEATPNDITPPPVEEKPQPPPTEDKPDTPAEEKPDTPPAEDKPDTPPIENKPDTSPAEDKPDTPSIEDKPDTPPMEEKPDTPTTEEKPDTPPIKDKPETPPLEDTPVGDKVTLPEDEPQPPPVEAKSPTPPVEKKPPPVQNKPHPIPVEAKSPTPPVEKKPRPPPVEAKSPLPPVEKKPRPPPVEAKSPTPPIEKKPRPPPVEDKPNSKTLSSSEDDHKQVVQGHPEPKIIVPMSTEPRTVSPNEQEKPVTPSKTKVEVTPSPSETPEERRGSSDGKKTKERKRTGLSKIFGKKTKDEKAPVPAKNVEVTRHSGDWEVLEAVDSKPAVTTPRKEPPPTVKDKPSPAVRDRPAPAVKPKRPQPAEQDTSGTPSEDPPSRKLAGGVMMPSVNMEQLNMALKKKPKPPPPTTDKPTEGSPKPARRTTMEPGPPAPKPRPKPRGPKKTPSSADVLTAKDEPVKGDDPSGNDLASTDPSDESLDTLV